MDRYKITSLEEITQGIYSPRSYAQQQKGLTLIFLLAIANIIGIIAFFILSDGFFTCTPLGCVR